MMATAASASAPVVVRPEANAGTMTRPLTEPITNALPTVAPANNALPTTDAAKIQGSSAMPTPSTRRPRRSTAVEVGVTPSAYHPGVTTYSRSERAALCDLLDEVGPDALTMCEGWVAKDLATHLFVRERRPLSGFGIFVPPLAPLAEHSGAQAQKRYGFTGIVDLLRQRPPVWAPHRYLDEALNTLEYFVHHEDVRRAQPGWVPRVLEPGEEDALWARLRGMLKLRASMIPAGTVLRRAGTDEELRGRPGEPGSTVRGPAGELVLWAFGRRSVATVIEEPGALSAPGDPLPPAQP